VRTRLHNEKIRSLYSGSNAIRVVKLTIITYWKHKKCVQNFNRKPEERRRVWRLERQRQEDINMVIKGTEYMDVGLGKYRV
jgi:hypothetical protein